MSTIVENCVHVLVVALAPPLLPGVIAKVKAAFGGRKGPPILQPYWNLIKLLQKGSVYSSTTTPLFRIGPIVGLASGLVALLLVPLAGPAPLGFPGDLVLLAYLFALSRFFTTLAALDTGSSFEGMGAAREAAFACLAEPAFFFGLLVLVKLSGSLELSAMLSGSLAEHWQTAGASLVLVLLSWFITLLVENCRVPFDDPNTHLELTMIHEVMVLDHSGPALGMIQYAAALKLFAYEALVVRLALPVATGRLWVDWPVFLGGIVALAAVVGVVESTVARLRLTQVPILLFAALLLSGFGFVLLMR